MATDSRWSIQSGNFVVYLDDTGFEKIEIRNDHAFMFAGNGGRIQQWKDWIRSDPKDDSAQPQEEGICLCVVNIQAKKVKSSFKQHIIPGGGYFAGSGALYAVPCWIKNACAKRSVETAKISDVFSGGLVQYYDFVAQSHNLNYAGSTVTIQMVDEAILKRGLVMTTNINSGPALPFAKAANDSSELSEIRDKISKGELSANAPAAGMYDTWTVEEKTELKKTLSDVFGWKT